MGFFFPACSGPLVGKGEGSWRRGLTQINLLAVTSPGRCPGLRFLEGKHPLCYECRSTLSTFTATQALGAVYFMG